MDQPIQRYFDDITVGMSGEFTKIISDGDVHAFAEATGDRNPIHLDDAYAADSIFGERISHGILTAGLISAAFAVILPGPGWIYVNQSLRFRAPVRIGDEVTARVEATNCIPEKNLVSFRTECRVGETLVLEGEATLLSPKHT